MVETIVTHLSHFIEWLFRLFGPLGGGVAVAMAIESACIPLPSELIMPFAGFLAVQGVAQTFYIFGSEHVTLFMLGLIGSIGCLLGSWLAYFVGYYGGRPFLEKYGKFILFSHHDMDTAEKFFNKYGEVTIFSSRIMPVVRTFISLPAGIAKMNFWRFTFYTIIGSIPWCWALAWAGWKIGKHAADITAWKETLKHSLGRGLHVVDALVLLLFIAALFWYIKRHIDHSKIEYGPREKSGNK
jgi:membrane protein DedA with SNARE-associated domain